MKILKAFSVLLCVFALIPAFSQDFVNYKKLKVPTIDASGKVYDPSGTLLGSVSKAGEIWDAVGAKIAHYDAFSAIIEESTGESSGIKDDDKGNMVLVKGTKVVSWKSSVPENAGLQLCLIKDKNSKVVATIHKSHKQYGTGALYYLWQKAGGNAEDVKVTASSSSKTKSVKTVTKKKKKAPAKKVVVKKKTKKK